MESKRRKEPNDVRAKFMQFHSNFKAPQTDPDEKTLQLMDILGYLTRHFHASDSPNDQYQIRSFIGDAYRYANQPDLAQHYYLYNAQQRPDIALAFSRLAIMTTLKRTSVLEAIYWFCHALARVTPAADAQQNMDKFYHTWAKQTQFDTRDLEVSALALIYHLMYVDYEDHALLEQYVNNLPTQADERHAMFINYTMGILIWLVYRESKSDRNKWTFTWCLVALMKTCKHVLQNSLTACFPTVSATHVWLCKRPEFVRDLVKSASNLGQTDRQFFESAFRQWLECLISQQELTPLEHELKSDVWEWSGFVPFEGLSLDALGVSCSASIQPLLKLLAEDKALELLRLDLATKRYALNPSALDPKKREMMHKIARQFLNHQIETLESARAIPVVIPSVEAFADLKRIRSLVDQQRVILTIPMAVVQELDRLKSSSKFAQKAIRFIDEQQQRNTGNLRVLTSKEQQHHAAIDVNLDRYGTDWCMSVSWCMDKMADRQLYVMCTHPQLSQICNKIGVPFFNQQ